MPTSGQVAHAHLLAQVFQVSGVGGVLESASRSAACRVLVPRSLTIASSVPLPSARPASSAVATLTSNQTSMLRETNWYDTM